MAKSRWARYGNGLLPGFAVALVSVVVAWVLGGPIAAALVAFLAVGAFLIDVTLCLSFFHTRLSGSRARPIAIGGAFYLASVIVVLVLVNFWGPSQIMQLPGVGGLTRG